MKYDASITPRQSFVDYSIPPTLAPVVGARLDGSASVDTSSGLLLTLLGELVLPNGGVAWTQTVIEVMELLDVREKAARQALARMAERGLLGREKVGRQTRWTLTDQARSLLVPGAERIYAFGQKARRWDGTWLVLLASVPETERGTRYRMRVGLSWAGFGSIGQGTWLSPWAQQEPLAVDLLKDLGVEATSFIARMGQLGSPTDLAAEAWDLPELGAAYDDFLADTAHAVDLRPKGEAAVGDLVALVHRWRRFPFLDPDLPHELLPDGWPAPDAVKRFARLRAARSAQAQQWWRDREADLDPER